MRQCTEIIEVRAQGRKLYDITPQVINWVNQQQFVTGLLTLYIQHTSASLLINENYDHDVLVDMEAFLIVLYLTVIHCLCIQLRGLMICQPMCEQHSPKQAFQSRLLIIS